MGVTNVNIIGKNEVGGLAGRIHNGLIASNCYTTGVVNGKELVGGFVEKNTATISNSYIFSNVSRNGGGYWTFGFCGNNGGKIEYCYAAGTNDNGSGARGFIGSNTGVATDNFYDLDTYGGSTSVGETAKTTAEMKIEATFSNWDFTTIWENNNNYPNLVNNSNPDLENVLVVEPIADVKVDTNDDGNADRIGEEVKISGVVTTPSHMQVTLLAGIQDETAGLLIYQPGNDTSKFTLGTKLEVTGILIQVNGTIGILISDYIKRGTEDLPALVVVTPQELNENGELYEGKLVQLKYVSKTQNSVWPSPGDDTNYYVTDQVDTATLYFFTDTHISDSAEAASPMNVNGLVAQEDTTASPKSNYEIWPRFYVDFEKAVAIELVILSLNVPPHALSTNIISMTADSAHSVFDGVEYSFECIADDAHSSGWQTFITFTDSTLEMDTEYAFAVKAKDSMGYETIASDTISVKTDYQSNLVYTEIDGKCVIEAEKANVLANGDFSVAGWGGIPYQKQMRWEADTIVGGYAGKGYMTTIDGIAANASWDNETELSWEVEISTEAEFFIAVRRNSNGDGANDSAKPGVDGEEKSESTFWGDVSEFTWARCTESLGTLSVGKHVIQIRRREYGFMLDRAMIATSLDSLPAEGSTEIGPDETLVPPTDIEVVNLSKEFVLEQNYPNPFSQTTVINYSIPNSGHVTLKVYNIFGEQVAELINDVKSAGSYQVNFNATKLTSGLYFYNISVGEFNITRRMMLTK